MNKEISDDLLGEVLAHAHSSWVTEAVNNSFKKYGEMKQSEFIKIISDQTSLEDLSVIDFYVVMYLGSKFTSITTK